MASTRQIWDLIKELQERATIVVSSHNLGEIQELCGHVAILNHGQLVLAGSIDEITRADHEYNLCLSRSLTDSKLEQLSSIEGMLNMKMLSRPSANQDKEATEYRVFGDM